MNSDMQSAKETLGRLPADLVTTHELSLCLRCNRKSIERMVARGILRPICIGSHWRFSRSQVVAALTATT
jgi:excisionase family DNA binding protein